MYDIGKNLLFLHKRFLWPSDRIQVHHYGHRNPQLSFYFVCTFWKKKISRAKKESGLPTLFIHDLIAAAIF